MFDIPGNNRKTIEFVTSVVFNYYMWDVVQVHNDLSYLNHRCQGCEGRDV
jgi:hypothetical protein